MSVPKPDSKLDTIEEMTERIASIVRQIDKAEAVWNPVDFDAHHRKIVKLINRRETLQIRRERL